jgi:hypothetical protein
VQRLAEHVGAGGRAQDDAEVAVQQVQLVGVVERLLDRETRPDEHDLRVTVAVHEHGHRIPRVVAEKVRLRRYDRCVGPEGRADARLEGVVGRQQQHAHCAPPPVPG